MNTENRGCDPGFVQWIALGLDKSVLSLQGQTQSEKHVIAMGFFFLAAAKPKQCRHLCGPEKLFTDVTSL